MAVRRYVTKRILDTALREKENNHLPMYVQISPLIFLTFGTVGVSLSRHYRASRIRDLKWVDNWYDMTANEINQAFADQEWEVHK